MSFVDPDSLIKQKIYERGERMGKFVIFYHTNVKYREPLIGVKRDAERLHKAVTGLGFESEIHGNMNCAPLLEQIETYAQEDHSDATCFALAIFTHGNYGDAMAASDGVDYNLSHVMEKFSAIKCKSLEGKPKLFLINTCRGTEEDHGSSTRSVVESKTTTLTIPKEADFLVAHSTCPDYKAAVDKDGSDYIAKFCEALEDDSLFDIHDILTHVNRTTARETCEDSEKDIQMPTFSSHITAALHLRSPLPKTSLQQQLYSTCARSLLHIVCNERYDEDVVALERVGSDLQFEVQYFSQLNECVDSKRQLPACDCLLFVIKTLSKEHDILYGTNGDIYKLKDFVKRFQGYNCPRLRGKPKIFIIQAPYKKVEAATPCFLFSRMPDIPETADTLIVYSTSPEPDPKTTGSTLFIHTLCRCLKSGISLGYDLQHILSLVTQRMSEVIGLHVPTITSQLREKVYFTSPFVTDEDSA